ncbi:MAG: hypothetical protein E7167_05665 [Firmicutes bacterium]|nr:hypothetical protein [Bacillota bacterium]
MSKKKRGFTFIILGIVLVIVGLFIMYMLRLEQKKHFDELYNSKKILTVEYGIIPPEEIFLEKNSLFKKIDQENYYFLHITEDNTLFTYYLDWYYSFDPLKGYNIVHEIKLKDEVVKNLMNDIKEKERESLYATVENEYVVLHHDDKETYIKHNDLQLILQSYDLMLSIKKGN